MIKVQRILLAWFLYFIPTSLVSWFMIHLFRLNRIEFVHVDGPEAMRLNRLIMVLFTVPVSLLIFSSVIYAIFLRSESKSKN